FSGKVSDSRWKLFLFLQCVVRVCCIRSFGHFLTNLQGNVLHFNPEAGIFTSINQSEQDNLSNGDEDTAGMVTILTGHEVDELCTRSAAMKAASSAGMELKNILEFYRQWKEIG
ncbi:hypothetical protein XENOCAPTIV_003857, partial [Xenoophorus captivus]